MVDVKGAMSSCSQHPLRIGLVGSGQVVRSYHLPALHRLGHTVVFTIDPSQEVLDALCAKYPSLKTASMFQAGTLPAPADAVLVASPSALHAEQTRLLLEMGCHVFCEKPLACRGDEAAKLAAFANTQGLILQVGYFRRRLASLRLIGRWLASNLFGSPLRIHLRGGNVLKRIPESFLNPALSGGGVLMDFGVHGLDLFASWVGDLQLIAYGDTAGPGTVEADAVVRLCGLAAGRHVPITMTLSRTRPLGYTVEVAFEKAFVWADLNTGHNLTLTLEDSDPLEVQVERPRDLVEHFASQWQEFAARIEGAPESLHSLADAIQTSVLAEQCYARRQSIDLPWGA